MPFDFQGAIAKNEKERNDNRRNNLDLIINGIVTCIMDEFEKAEKLFNYENITIYEKIVLLQDVYQSLKEEKQINGIGLFIDDDDENYIDVDIVNTIGESVLSKIGENYSRYISYDDDEDDDINDEREDIEFTICIKALDKSELNSKYDHIKH